MEEKQTDSIKEQTQDSKEMNPVLEAWNERDLSSPESEHESGYNLGYVFVMCYGPYYALKDLEAYLPLNEDEDAGTYKEILAFYDVGHPFELVSDMGGIPDDEFDLVCPSGKPIPMSEFTIGFLYGVMAYIDQECLGNIEHKETITKLCASHEDKFGKKISPVLRLIDCSKRK